MTGLQQHAEKENIHITAVADPGLDTAALHDQLTGALTHAGLPAPGVTVRVAATLERHPQTGKLRRFIPLPSQHSRPPR